MDQVKPAPELAAPCAACGLVGLPGCDRADCPQAISRGERPAVLSLASLSSVVDAGALGAVPPGELPESIEPEIPPELDAALNARERRTAWHMIAGRSYLEALDLQGIPKRAALRDAGPPDHLKAAVNACLRQIARNAGVSRNWIVENTVALYRRAAQAEPVLDRKGVPTGEYRFDGATAAKCLTMLAEWCPELTARKGGLRASDVADLLLAIAARGRQGLDLARAQPTGRTLEHARATPGIAALQQPAKAL